MGVLAFIGALTIAAAVYLIAASEAEWQSPWWWRESAKRTMRASAGVIAAAAALWAIWALVS